MRSEQGMHDCWACTAPTPTSSSIITKQLCYHIKGGRVKPHGVQDAVNRSNNCGVFPPETRVARKSL